MNIRTFVAPIIFGLLASCLLADDFYPLPSTNAIVLNFDSGIPQVVRERIREDFDRCLLPFASEVELYHFDRDPTNRLSLAGFWQPFSGFAATSGPTNNPPYLWCTVPRLTENGRTSANMMLFFQGRWRFSVWPFIEGEQQW